MAKRRFRKLFRRARSFEPTRPSLKSRRPHFELLEYRQLLDGQGFNFPGRAFEVGDDPNSVAYADFDGDGQIDLVTANTQSGTVSVLRNLGNRLFAPRVDYAVGRLPYSVTSADVNRDGHIDIVAANYSDGTISVLRNLGNGTFAAKVDYAAPGTPLSVIATDVNSDGNVDLVATNPNSNTVVVLRNLRNGTFAPWVRYTVGIDPTYLTAADIDGDGDVDLLAVAQAASFSPSRSISTLKNLGNGTFAPRDHVVGGFLSSLAVADVDGDLNVDRITTSSNSNVVSVERNLGNGTFAPRVNYVGVGNSSAVRTLDVDGDGRVDLVTTHHGSNTVSVFQNLGNGTFAPRVDYSANLQGPVVVTDVDLDGQVDLITANNFAGAVSVLWNLLEGTHDLRADYVVGANPESVTSTDVDGDGLVDLVVANNRSDTVSVLRNLGSGAFATRVDYAAGSGPRSVTAADVNGDGRPDLVVAGLSGTVSVLRNLGNGTFAPRADYSVGGILTSVTAVDLDGDGRVELVAAHYVTNGSNTVSVLRNLGDGTFAPRVGYTTGREPKSVTAADVNGDGHVDLITANSFITGTVSVLRNLGNGAFASRVDYATGTGTSSVTSADVDGDGHIDLVAANAFSNTVSVLRNLGTGAFAPRVDYASGRRPSSVTATDVDGDGHVDLVTANSGAGTVSVLRNSGSGAFDVHVDFLVRGNPSSVVAADVDGDGYVDLVTANDDAGLSSPSYNLTASVLRNLGPEDPGGSQADLIVASVSTLPSSVTLGQTLHVDYTVRNAGQQAAQGGWTDAIYLSRDGVFDTADRLLTRVPHSGGLDRNQTYTQSVDVAAPFFAGFVPGEWRVLVRTDAGHDVVESSNVNNVGASAPFAIQQQVTALALGDSFAGEIAVGASRYFSVDYAAGQPLAFRLDGLRTDGTVELFLKRDGLPTQNVFDRSSRTPFAREQHILLPPQAEAGTFFVLVRAATLAVSPAAFELTAWTPDYAVLTNSFGTAGNAGDFTILAIGGGFDATVNARLVDSQGFELAAKSYYLQDATRLYATFDLRGVAPGRYDVVFTNAAELTVTKAQSFTVVSAPDPAAVIPRVIVPSAIRRDSNYSFTVEWENTSQNDAYAPLLTVGNSSSFGLTPRDRNSLGTRYTFLGVNTQEGPAGILRSGQRESITFYGYSDTEEGEYTVFVDRVLRDLSTPFDWEDAITRVRPAAMSDEQLVALAAFLRLEYGADAAGYLRFLSGAASAAWDDVRNPANLAREETLRAWAHFESGIYGSVSTSENAPEGGFTINAVDSSSGWLSTTHTDRLGRFHFPNLSDGVYKLSVLGAVISNTEARMVELNAGQSKGPIELLVSPAPATVFQLNLRAGQPLSNETVIVYLGEEPISSGVTDDLGRVTLLGVAPGEYTLLVKMEEGWFRTYGQLVVPAQALDVVNVNLTSATISGHLAEGTKKYPVLVSTGEDLGAIHADVSEDSFVLHAPTGQYRLLIFDANGNQIEDVGVFDLSDGTTIDVGEVGNTLLAASHEDGHDDVLWFDDAEAYVRLPYVDSSKLSAIAKIDIELLFRNPDLVESVRWPAVVAGVFAAYGQEYVSVLRQFLNGDSSRRLFADGSDTVESGGGLNGIGFLNHPVTDVWLDGLLTSTLGPLKTLIEEGNVILDCGESESFDLLLEIQPLVPSNDERGQRFFYQDGNMEGEKILEYFDTLAGGVGHYGTPPGALIPDWRGITGGSVKLTKGSNGQYTAELEGVRLQVHDGFDFWPGNLGVGTLDTYATTILLFLEINGRTADVPFDVIWTNEKPYKKVISITGGDDCDICEGPNPPDSCEEIKRPNSFDPNDIIGPAGYGQDNHIVATSVMPYTIRFENDADQATAPAAMVTITQTLDADLDWTTFRLGEIGFGEVVIEVPANTAFLETRYDATATLGVFVDIEAGIDVATGKVFWQFVAVDPETGDLPEDPFVGFLPPNVNSPEGEGFVTYSVRPKATVKTGDRIDAVASIVFDVNEPIVTPAIFHTIDVGAPTSSVASLPTATIETSFQVHWSGADDAGGSGIRRFDVYVSIDGGQFQRWKQGVVDTSATYVGEYSRSYAFYSVAIDNVGHMESAPAAIDAFTTLLPLDAVPPAVVATTVQNGLTQRSYVDRLVVDFSEQLDLAALIAEGSITSAVTLTNFGANPSTDAGQLVTLSASQFRYEYDAIAGISRLTWSLDQFTGMNASLGDGLYEFVFDGELMTDLAGNRLDGDGNGLGGDDFVLSFHRLSGDANGDRAVNATDMTLVNAALGSRPGVAAWNANADLDRDGVVTTRDRLVVSRGTGHAIVAAVTVGLPGDYNSDGSVNSADYTVWRDEFGATRQASLAADGDGNGAVDGHDFLVWQRNFGNSTPQVTEAALAIPSAPSMEAAPAAVYAPLEDMIAAVPGDSLQSQSRGDLLGLATAANPSSASGLNRGADRLSFRSNQRPPYSTSASTHWDAEVLDVESWRTSKANALSDGIDIMLNDSEERFPSAIHDMAFAELFADVGEFSETLPKSFEIPDLRAGLSKQDRY